MSADSLEPAGMAVATATAAAMEEETGAEVLSFGCRLNHFESEVLRARLRAAGACRLVVINSCAVTAQAERQLRKAIREVRRRRPEARILVTGCAAELDPQRWSSMPEVAGVFGDREKQSLLAGRPLAGFESRTRAVLQVQTGCDHRCSFCVIPLARGASRSLPQGQVVEQARAFAEAGTGEVVLSGVDLTAWGRDLPGAPALGDLAAALLAGVPGLRRLRLSSLDPAEIDEGLWRLLAEEPRLMPHLHLSLQSGDDLVLRRMKRRHRRADALALARRARELRPEVALGADLIAGFPTESEAAFRRTRELVEECGLVYLHVFPYSERPGTAAARMPQLPPTLRRERAAQLRAAGDMARERFLRRKVGTSVEVLVERNGVGRGPDFAPVRLSGSPQPGRFCRVVIRAYSAGELLASAPGPETDSALSACGR